MKERDILCKSNVPIIMLFILMMLFSMILFGQEKNETNTPELFVFVGEKVEVKEYKPVGEDAEWLMDFVFKAKYKVLENIYGDLGSKEVEFTVYDHYGTPHFSKYKHVLLYLVKIDGEYFHCKYMFSPLFKTKEGKWAGPYDYDDYHHEYNKETSIKPELIDFAENAYVYIDKLIPRNEISQYYPKPYFKVTKRKAIAIYGNYIPELFQLKMNGFLKARGLLLDK